MHQLTSPDDLTVYYYLDWENSTELDQRARFYRSIENPSEFYVEHANAGDSYPLSTVLLSNNVTDLEFFKVDNGYTMNLSLDDGREQITIVSTALLHN